MRKELIIRRLVCILVQIAAALAELKSLFRLSRDFTADESAFVDIDGTLDPSMRDFNSYWNRWYSTDRAWTEYPPDDLNLERLEKRVDQLRFDMQCKGLSV